MAMEDERDFDFSDDDAARDSMKEFIRDNFSEHLEGLDDLFEQPNWYERLSEALEDQVQETARELPENLRKLRKMLERFK
jgi:hypothetical protein